MLPNWERPLDKSVYWKTIFFITHPKHMLDDKKSIKKHSKSYNNTRTHPRVLNAPDPIADTVYLALQNNRMCLQTDHEPAFTLGHPAAVDKTPPHFIQDLPHIIVLYNINMF